MATLSCRSLTGIDFCCCCCFSYFCVVLLRTICWMEVCFFEVASAPPRRTRPSLQVSVQPCDISLVVFDWLGLGPMNIHFRENPKCLVLFRNRGFCCPHSLCWEPTYVAHTPVSLKHTSTFMFSLEFKVNWPPGFYLFVCFFVFISVHWWPTIFVTFNVFYYSLLCSWCLSISQRLLCKYVYMEKAHCLYLLFVYLHCSYKNNHASFHVYHQGALKLQGQDAYWECAVSLFGPDSVDHHFGRPDLCPWTRVWASLFEAVNESIEVVFQYLGGVQWFVVCFHFNGNSVTLQWFICVKTHRSVCAQ